MGGIGAHAISEGELATRSIWMTRLAAALIIVWAFGSYGLSRHGHEPYPTGRLPGFESAPVADGVATNTDLVVVATFEDGEIRYDPNELLGDTGVSIDQVLRNRLARPFEPSGGLERLTWNLVGPGSPLRRNQPLNYVETRDTEVLFVKRVVESEGRQPLTIAIEQITLRFDADSGSIIDSETKIAVVICEECTP